MSTKLSRLYKLLAVLILAIYGYSFGHIVYMGLQSLLNECVHAATSHEICLLSVELQKGAGLASNLLLSFALAVIIYILSFKFLEIKKNKNHKFSFQENIPPPLINRLLAVGILNTKVF